MNTIIPFLYDGSKGNDFNAVVSSSSSTDRSNGFNSILSEKYALQQTAPSSPAIRQDSAQTAALSHLAKHNREGAVILGELTENTPTVSHLLKAHPELKNKTWEIVFSPINRDKAYDNLPVGTVVQYHPESKELTWQTTGKKTGYGEIPPSHNIARADTSDRLTYDGDYPVEEKKQVMANAPVSLGRIDRNNPTVSHLVHQHNDFRPKVWELLSSDVNRNKPFHQISSGTEIFIHPNTMEITWRNSAPAVKPSPAALSQVKDESAPAPMDLTEAVQPFMGKEYEDVDCYELLVAGLKRMDIPYAGKDGLYNRLTRMAKDNGLSVNAYLNGEGIVKAAGSTLLEKRISAPADWRKEAEGFYRQLEPMLKKGQILSFSTQSRGHTGIVSQQQNQWTFINSGRLDNSLTKNPPRKGVGEEVLQEEVRNWFRLAHTKNQTLSITLGQIEQDKILARAEKTPTLSQQI